jgi:endoglucanase
MRRAFVFLVAACSTTTNPAGGPDGGGPDATMDSPSGSEAGYDAGPIIAPQPVSADLVVDQFGYRTGDEKIAVARSPVTGFDSSKPYAVAAKYALVDAHSTKTLLEMTPTAWNNGATDSSSGDKAWWLDFSTVATPGDYFVLDETANVRSYVFSIRDDVYADVLVQAERMFYYQRDGTSKPAQYAGSTWADGSEHMGAGQGPQCTLYNGSTQLDLHGGWWDAGDQNKYTNWAASDVIVLLRAFAETPGAFGDATNIPESGNGVPDILDEAKWELDWLSRMQGGDGSVLSIVGQNGATPPSQGGSTNTAPSLVTSPCKYGPASTSATFSAAAAYAYASIVFAASPAANTTYAGYAAGLATRAQNAWTWATANSNVTFYNTGILGAGEQEMSAQARALKQLQAAAFLFELTGNAQYKTYFDANYTSAQLIASSYLDMFDLENVDTLLEYTKTTGATPSVVSNIESKFKGGYGSNNNLGATLNNSDPYLGYLYTYVWGSNQTKADQGNLLVDDVVFAIDPTKNADATRGGERYIHWMHGTNPLSFVFLTNMTDHGAEQGATRIYHTWFANGSIYPAPPGYVPGGPNPTYNWDTCCPNGCSGNSCGGSAPLSPPAGQPPQKSYADFNNDWPIDSWQVTEPDLAYQAKYVRLLSKFAQ